MQQNQALLRNDEKAVFGLRSIYKTYGYSQYKMNKFEEYDLYVRNKDFLVSDRVITFTDVSGKLLALKPDVTMSIINDTKDIDGYVHKFFYSENVYRANKGAFKEIMQTGLECIGDIDLYNISEVIMLAVKSLESISENYVLDISHMGFINALLDSAELTSQEREKLLVFLGEKNVYAVQELLVSCGAEKDIAEKISKLVSSYGRIDEMIKTLEELNINEQTNEALCEIKALYNSLKVCGCTDKINLDFSVVNNMHYYNNIVFTGYIDKIPQCVLSGGQYDKLMKKMKRKSRAIGFALYLDLLDMLDKNRKQYDADVLVLYNKDDDFSLLTKCVEQITSQGKTVLTQKAVSGNAKCKEVYRLCGDTLEKVEVAK